MRIFLPQIEIAEEEGFTPAKDVFNLADFGTNLANLIGAVDDPLVIALDGPWGSGKTTFIKMWAGLLRQRGHPVVYFDAFANDYIDDAFLAIAGEVIALSQQKKKDKTSSHKRLLETATRAGRAILRSGAKIGVKAATLGALDASDISELKSVATDIANEAGAKTDEYIKSLLTRQSDEKKSIEGFRKALSEMAVTLGDPKVMSATPQRNALPLIFIVDELDRCKPPFALELLEKIKHVFSVPNIHFLLVSNLVQVENSVRSSYGNEIDARTYLHKFYNLIVHLPGDGKYESEWGTTKFIKYLKTHLAHDQSALEFIELVARARGLTYRTIEKAAIYASLAIASTTSKNRKYFRPAPILAGLCILKVLDPALFQKAKSGSLTLKDASDVFAFSAWPEGHSREWAQKWWGFSLSENLDSNDDTWRGCASALWDFHLDRENIVRFVANSVIDKLEIPAE